MNILRSALDVLQRARRPFMVLNLVYFGLVALAMGYVSFDRSLQESFDQVIAAAMGTPITNTADVTRSSPPRWAAGRWPP